MRSRTNDRRLRSRGDVNATRLGREDPNAPDLLGRLGSDQGSTAAGAGGFEPPVGDPKSPALPLGHAPMDTGKSRCAGRALGRGRALGTLAAADELGDAPAALAAERGVALAPELRLAGLAAAPAQLRVAGAPELRLAGFPALAPELGVALGTELTLAGLASAAADLAVEVRPVLVGRVLPAFLARL